MKLGFGPGEGPRLFAPGAPDWIGTDGVRLGWILRDRLYLLQDGEVSVVDLTDEGFAAMPAPTHWTVALDRGFVLVDVASAELVGGLFEDDTEPLTMLPGADVGVVVAVPEHQLVRLADGLPLPLPDGAQRSRWLAPFARGPGACWVDLDTLYRMGARISALARVPGCDGIAVGPEGSVLVSMPEQSVVAAARGVAVELSERLATEGARFSADGQRLLACTEEGIALVDLVDGKILRRWEGELLPVGFGTTAWRLDLASGTVRDEADTVIADGFCGPTPGLGGACIAGPGGKVWQLDGTVVRAGLPEGVAATDGTRVIVVDAQRLWLDGVEVPHRLCAEEDEVVRVTLTAEAIEVVTRDGEHARFDAAGTLTAQHHEDPEADDVGEHPLGADGHRVEDGHTLVWTLEGLFARLD